MLSIHTQRPQNGATEYAGAQGSRKLRLSKARDSSTALSILPVRRNGRDTAMPEKGLNRTILRR
jgi:hypothetical protein